MSDDVVIRVENLGKKYRIRHNAERQRYTALRDVIAHKLKAPFQFLRRSQKSEVRSQTSDLRPPTSARSSSEDFWALRDVSFEVKQGEVVGIIGRNGAGKSTLLKILSRITEPTEGRVRILGRVASLLEVGTGFHPELTGRENVFLNGAILGMHRAEIRKKFDEIVAFAEVEKFLDTPVKRYSSGMYVRLAFAVAAHLEPEILIVDEVLAVGDAAFQEKCLGKMKDVASCGRTVLFVSHNITAIRKLCPLAIYLKQATLVKHGSSANVCSAYLHDVKDNDLLRTKNLDCSVKISTVDDQPIAEWHVGEEIKISVMVTSEFSRDRMAVDLAFYSPEGVKIFAVESDKLPNSPDFWHSDKLWLLFKIKNPGLCLSELYMDVGIRSNDRDGYIGLFERSNIIPIAPMTLPHVREDVIVNFPITVEPVTTSWGV